MSLDSIILHSGASIYLHLWTCKRVPIRLCPVSCFFRCTGQRGGEDLIWVNGPSRATQRGMHGMHGRAAAHLVVCVTRGNGYASCAGVCRVCRIRCVYVCVVFGVQGQVRLVGCSMLLKSMAGARLAGSIFDFSVPEEWDDNSPQKLNHLTYSR